jgi:hypothetical protein
VTDICRYIGGNLQTSAPVLGGNRQKTYNIKLEIRILLRKNKNNEKKKMPFLGLKFPPRPKIPSKGRKSLLNS